MSIILSLSVISLPTLSKRNTLSIDKQVQIISGYIIQARDNALNKHEKTELLFSSNNLQIKSTSLNKTVKLDANYNFSNTNEIYYNDQGNINMANHVDIIGNQETKTIVFNLGSGSFYVR